MNALEKPFTGAEAKRLHFSVGASRLPCGRLSLALLRNQGQEENGVPGPSLSQRLRRGGWIWERGEVSASEARKKAGGIRENAV